MNTRMFTVTLLETEENLKQPKRASMGGWSIQIMNYLASILCRHLKYNMNLCIHIKK